MGSKKTLFQRRFKQKNGECMKDITISIDYVEEDSNPMRRPFDRDIEYDYDNVDSWSYSQQSF